MRGFENRYDLTVNGLEPDQIERDFVGMEHVESVRRNLAFIYAVGPVVGSNQFFSGFILEFDGEWLWCSAGHCLQRIQEYMNQEASKFAIASGGLKLGKQLQFDPRHEIGRASCRERV